MTGHHRKGVITVGDIGREEKVIILEPLEQPGDVPVTEPSPVSVPERETVPA
jgi:hypothetical protein